MNILFIKHFVVVLVKNNSHPPAPQVSDRGMATIYSG